MAKYTLSKRKANVIDMYTLIFEEVHKKYKISYEKLATIAEKYDLYKYIDISYERFNSIGLPGIVVDIEEFIQQFGGTLNIK